MTRNERLLRLARLRGDRAAELIVSGHSSDRRRVSDTVGVVPKCATLTRQETVPATVTAMRWTEAELRAAWGDR